MINDIYDPTQVMAMALTANLVPKTRPAYIFIIASSALWQFIFWNSHKYSIARIR